MHTQCAQTTPFDEHAGAPAVCWVADPPLLQEPRHLQLLGGLEESSIFSLIAGKKQYSAPTDYGFCIKVPPSCPVWSLCLPVASHQGLWDGTRDSCLGAGVVWVILLQKHKFPVH